MNTRIEKEELKDYLDRFSKQMPAELVEIEVAGLNLGDQIQTSWTPLTGLSYDPYDDAVVVNINNGKLEHIIPKPIEFWVEEGTSGIMAMNIKSAEGLQHILYFREPKKLPAPAIL